MRPAKNHRILREFGKAVRGLMAGTLGNGRGAVSIVLSEILRITLYSFLYSYIQKTLLKY